MRAVITVIGKDKPGIIAQVSNLLYRENINILDISQTIMQELFTMVMLVDMSAANREFETVAAQLETLEKELGVSVRIQHEDLFQSMHRI